MIIFIISFFSCYKEIFFDNSFRLVNSILKVKDHIYIEIKKEDNPCQTFIDEDKNNKQTSDKYTCTSNIFHKDVRKYSFSTQNKKLTNLNFRSHLLITF